MRPDEVHPGAVFYAKSKGSSDTPVRLSSLFRIVGKDQVYGLAYRIGVKPAQGHGSVDFAQLKAGLLSEPQQISELFGKADDLDKLFVILTFAKSATDNMYHQLRPVSVSRDVIKNIFSRGDMRVRCLRPEKLDGRNSYPKRVFGFMTGDITRPVVDVGDDRVVIDRAGKARGKGGRAFAAEGDGGAPVVSSTGALLGFVVAGTDEETLIIPAEDLKRRFNIEFVAPEGDQTPFRLVSPSRDTAEAHGK